MFKKFSKQIGNSFAKIIITKMSLKPFKQLKWCFFRKSLLASEANSEYCHTAKTELFAKIVKNEKPFTVFTKTCILDVWQGFEYAFGLASKIKDVSFLKQFKYQR